jgi:hypothetical protein
MRGSGVAKSFDQESTIERRPTSARKADFHQDG